MLEHFFPLVDVADSHVLYFTAKEHYHMRCLRTCKNLSNTFFDNPHSMLFAFLRAVLLSSAFFIHTYSQRMRNEKRGEVAISDF